MSTVTAGIDVGNGAVKTVLMRVGDDGTEWLARSCSRVRQRDPLELARATFDEVLEAAGLAEDKVEYVATTGEGESVPFHTGHFYSMTTHARGAIYLEPQACAVLDVGALHGRAIAMNERGKVLNYKMTSQCASGSGQFLENIARYLGIAQDEIGPLSAQADNPEVVSSICAVLAETDVINMVSRGISAANIIKGIHMSMAIRLARLLKSIRINSGVVMVSGGLALDKGLIATLNEEVGNVKNMAVTIRSHPDSQFAGAIGAALWGAYRFDRLVERGEMHRAA